MVVKDRMKANEGYVVGMMKYEVQGMGDQSKNSPFGTV